MANTAGSKNTTMMCYYLDSVGLVAKITFVRESHGFHIWKPFTTCTYFFSAIYIFLMSWNGKYHGDLKYSDGVLFLGFPGISCKNNICTSESWFSHLDTI